MLLSYLETVRERVLPRYEQLGVFSFAYLQGSLVSGYTADSDLDLILVWDQPEVPLERTGVVARLEERPSVEPFVVDYQDIHLERFVLQEQEYNAGHLTVGRLDAIVQEVLAGRGLVPSGVLTPLIAVSGFCYGLLMSDRDGQGQRLRSRLAQFPEALKAETRRVLEVRRESYLGDLEKFAARADWLMFHATLVDAVRTALQALFSEAEVYYPGDKWLRESMVKFGLDAVVVRLFDETWGAQAPAARIEAVRQLMNTGASNSPSG